MSNSPENVSLEVPPTGLSAWSNDQVVDWFYARSLDKCVQPFLEHKVTGEAFELMTKEQMAAIGVTSKLHQIQIETQRMKLIAHMTPIAKTKTYRKIRPIKEGHREVFTAVDRYTKTAVVLKRSVDLATRNNEKNALKGPIFGLHVIELSKETPEFLVFPKGDFTLEDLMSNPERKLSRSDVFIIMRDVAEGLKVIHEAGFVHGNLCPKNIVCFTKARGHFYHPWKLVDFGCCMQEGSPSNLSVKYGSAAYWAPELAQPEARTELKLSAKQDIWAFGLILLELLSKCTRLFDPQLTNREIVPALANPSFRVDYKRLDGFAQHNITLTKPENQKLAQTLNLNPTQRPAAEDLLNDQFLLPTQPTVPTPAPEIPLQEVAEPVKVVLPLVESMIPTLLAENPKPEDVKFSYGTAGFRTKANILQSVCVRMGMFAGLRTRYEFASSHRAGHYPTTGLMLTASHNAEPDNGLKMVDPSGDMMDQDWEERAVLLANADGDQVLDCLRDLAGTYPREMWWEVPTVYIGMDTRPSSPELYRLLGRGLESVVAKVVPLGLVTTPQLHYVVMQSNGPTPEKANVKSYYEQFCAAFRELIPEGKTITPTLIDCANGVGKLAGAEFKARLSDVFAMDLYNTGDTNLNDLCGAEFVQKQRKFPRSFKGDEMAGKKMCAVDGDADRLVYFYVDEKSGELALLDGDKITCLVAGYIKQLLVKAGLVEKVSMGIVQTAYANGASTKYMQNDLKVDVQMAKTGVKYIHHKAAECFEIGVYFEANGHGTVIFGFAAQRAFANELTALQREPEKLDPELWSSDDEVESSDENKNSNGYANLSADDKASRIQAIQQLQAVTRLVNPAVGDAFADMLLVEIILTTQGMTLQDWGALYQDFPSRMLKTKVPDRTAVITTNAERTCTAPVGLQAAVDKLVANPDNTSARRAFVRPSGTEDAVRIYAEADTQADADALAQAITEKVNEFCSK